MGRRDDQRKIKLSVLSKIHKHKDLLFGSFSERLTKEDKRRGWAAVSAHARAAGVRGAAGGNANYMRDIWWQNAKKATLEKLDIAKEPGGAEQVARRWNEFDDAVLQIVGKEAPSVDVARVAGSDTDSTWSRTYELLDETKTECGNESDLREDPLQQADTECDLSVKKELMEYRQSASITKKSCSSTFKLKRRDCEDESMGMSKVELEMELLRLQVYTARLEARRLELALGLPPSALTAAAGVACGPPPPPDDSSRDSFA